MSNNISITENNSFQAKWGNQLSDISLIIEFIHFNPLIAEKLELKNLLTVSELIANQNEWVKLLEKYDGLEKDFFKPYWVPILKGGLIGVFIDLSDFNYPLFHVEYLNSKSEKYVKLSLVKSIQELLTFKDNAFELEGIYLNYLECKDELIWNHFSPKPKNETVFVDKYYIIIEIALLGFIFESTVKESDLKIYIDTIFFELQNYNLDKMHELENIHLIEEYAIHENGKSYQNTHSHGGTSNGFVNVDYVKLESGFSLKSFVEERGKWRDR